MTGIIHNLFATTDFPNNNGALLKQKGEEDCGLFSIAIATALAF